MSPAPARAIASWTRLALLAAAALVPAAPAPARAQVFTFEAYEETATWFRLLVKWSGAPGNNLLTVGRPAGFPTDFWTPTVGLRDLNTDGDYGGFRFCAVHKKGPHKTVPPLDVDPNDVGCLFLHDPFAAALPKTPGGDAVGGPPPYLDLPDGSGAMLGKSDDHPTTGAPHPDSIWVQYQRPVAGGAVLLLFLGEHRLTHDDLITMPEPATPALLASGGALGGAAAWIRRRGRRARVAA